MALIAAALGLIVPAAFASVVDMPEEKVIANVVVSEDQYLSPGTVTVIRPEDYKGEVKTLPDLLKLVPGVSIRNNSYPAVSPYIRGSHPNTVGLYVDGVNMNVANDSMYPADLNRIPYDQIERVEVYKGFVPARFAHQGMGGIINIVTRMPKERETNLSLGIGSYGKFHTAVSHSEPIGSGTVSGYFGYESYKGDFDYWYDNGTIFNPADDFKNKRIQDAMENVNLMMKYYDDNWRFRVSYNRRQSDYGDLYKDVPGAFPYRPDLIDYRRWDISLGRTQQWGKLKWGWDIAYSDSISDLKVFDPFYQYGSPIDMLFTRFEVGLHGEMPVGERQMISGIIEYSSEKYTQKDDIEIQLESRLPIWNINIQDEIMLDEAGTFLFTPSLRYTDMDGMDKLTWQLALSKEFSNGIMLKTSYGTYSRIPNTYQRFGGDGMTLANPDLKPETGTQFDAGISWQGVVASLGNANVGISFAGYLRETEDLIDYEDISYWPVYTGHYVNVHKASVHGLEFAAALDWEKWNFALSAGYTDSENKDPASFNNGRRLDYIPLWDTTLRLTRKFSKGSIFAEYQYYGEYFNGGSYNPARYVESSSSVNVGAKYKINDTFTLSGGVNDLFDNTNGLRQYNSSYTYDPVTFMPNGIVQPYGAGTLPFPYAGRTFYLTLDAKF